MSDNVFNRDKQNDKQKKPTKPKPSAFQKFLGFLKILLWIIIGLPMVIIKWITVLAFNTKTPELFERLLLHSINYIFSFLTLNII